MTRHEMGRFKLTQYRKCAWLDSLSVRCLSSYLFFAHILVTKYAPLRRREPTAVCVPSILPLHESKHPEELVTLNFRGLGTGYRPVLLTFATLLLLGVLILAAGGPESKLPVSSSNQFGLSSLTASNSAPRSLDLSHLPMRFEPNQGQTDPQVKFLARGRVTVCFLPRARQF